MSVENSATSGIYFFLWKKTQKLDACKTLRTICSLFKFLNTGLPAACYFPGCTGQTLEYLFHLLKPSFHNNIQNMYRPWTSSSSQSRTAANTNTMPHELMDKTVLSMQKKPKPKQN